MDKLKFQGQYKSDTDSIKVNLALFHFIEEKLHFIYCPNLDLTGYGNTKEEAITSFKETMTEFLKYTSNKKTLDKELKKLGWTVIQAKKKQPKRYDAPDLNKLLRDNDYLIDIVNTKDFSKSSSTIHLPAFV